MVPKWSYDEKTILLCTIMNAINTIADFSEKNKKTIFFNYKLVSLFRFTKFKVAAGACFIFEFIAYFSSRFRPPN